MDQKEFPPFMSITTTVTAIILPKTFNLSGGKGIYYCFRISTNLASMVFAFVSSSISVDIANGVARSTLVMLRESWNFLNDEQARQVRSTVKAIVMNSSEMKWLNKAQFTRKSTPKMDPDTVIGSVMMTRLVSMAFLCDLPIFLPQLEQIEAVEPPSKKMQVMAMLVLVSQPSPIIKQMLIMGPPPIPAA